MIGQMSLKEAIEILSALITMGAFGFIATFVIKGVEKLKRLVVSYSLKST